MSEILLDDEHSQDLVFSFAKILLLSKFNVFLTPNLQYKTQKHIYSFSFYLLHNHNIYYQRTSSPNKCTKFTLVIQTECLKQHLIAATYCCSKHVARSYDPFPLLPQPNTSTQLF